MTLTDARTLSAGALAGITQKCVQTIAADLGVDYEVGNLLRSDLYTAAEAFLSGTAAEVVPIRAVDDRELGEPGPVTRAVQDTYFAAVKGEVDRYKVFEGNARRVYPRLNKLLEKRGQPGKQA